MSLIEFVFAGISAIIGIAAVAIPLWRSRQRCGLRWAYLPPTPMLDVADEVASRLVITYDGEAVDSLIRHQFILHNTGFTPLEATDIDIPLTWYAPGNILDKRVEITDPPVDLTLDVENNKELKVSWTLFNQRCKALITVLCVGDADTGCGQVRGSIKNVPKIEQKAIRWDDPEQRIREMRDNVNLRGNAFARVMGLAVINRPSIRVLTGSLVA